MKYLLMLLPLALTGCMTNPTWEQKPTVSFTGVMEGEFVMYDPYQRPPEHPGWRTINRALDVIVPVAALTEFGKTARQPATVVETPAPQIVRPEIVNPVVIQ
jgi:hypothetical protein